MILVPGQYCKLPSPPASLHSLQPTLELLQEHYAELKDLPFFSGLTKFMSSGPVVAMVSGRDCAM